MLLAHESSKIKVVWPLLVKVLDTETYLVQNGAPLFCSMWYCMLHVIGPLFLLEVMIFLAESFCLISLDPTLQGSN